MINSTVSPLEEPLIEAEKLDRCPRKEEISPELVVKLKAQYGTWTRVLEAAGFREVTRPITAQNKNDNPQMPLGIFAWFGYELPLAESLRHIRAAGFDQVLLWWGEFEGDIPLMEQPDTVRRLGLQVENAHAPFQGCNSLWVDGLEGDAYVDSLINCINGCADTGVPTLVVHLTDLANPPICHMRGVERLKRAVEAAEKRQVVLAFENLRHTPHLFTVMKNFTSPYVGFCYDSGHHNGWCQGAPFLKKFGSRLAALHLHDNNRIKDLHNLPFDGNIHWRELAKKLAATGYCGGVSLEVQAFGYEKRMGVDEFLERAYRSAYKVRSMIYKQSLQMTDRSHVTR